MPTSCLITDLQLLLKSYLGFPLHIKANTITGVIERKSFQEEGGNSLSVISHHEYHIQASTFSSGQFKKHCYKVDSIQGRVIRVLRCHDSVCDISGSFETPKIFSLVKTKGRVWGGARIMVFFTYRKSCHLEER